MSPARGISVYAYLGMAGAGSRPIPFRASGGATLADQEELDRLHKVRVLTGAVDRAPSVSLHQIGGEAQFGKPRGEARGVGNVVGVALDRDIHGELREPVGEPPDAADGEIRPGCMEPLVQAVAEEEHALVRHVHDTRVGSMVASDMLDHGGDAAQVNRVAMLVDDGRNDDRKRAAIGKLELHHVAAKSEFAAVGDSRVERSIRPVVARLNLKLLGGLPVCDHRHVHGRRAEAVIPVPVGERDGDDRRPAAALEFGHERPEMIHRRSALDQQRVGLAVHSPERGPIGAVIRSEPVGVRGERLETGGSIHAATTLATPWVDLRCDTGDMRIVRIRCYRQWQPFVAGTYATSSGSAAGFDSLVVAVDTDDGVTGWGEMAPLGTFYDAAFSAGARAAAELLSAALVGTDPRQPRRVTLSLDGALRGHAYAKSAFDMACWDASAQSSGQPLCEALGGRFGERVALYRSIAPGGADEMASTARQYVEAGYRRLQVKVGGDPLEDAERIAAVRDAVGAGVVLFADANGGWTTGRALTFLEAARSQNFTLEQPCATLEECAAVRPHCPHPLVLDESIDSVAALSYASSRRICDGVTVKIARVGGVTRAAQIRDLAVELGLEVTVEDTGGASIDTAAMLHLSLSTPESARLHTVDFNAWVTVDNADGIPSTTAGGLAAPEGPGLGIVVREAALGDPFHVQV